MNLKTTYWLFGILMLLLVIAAVSLMTGSKTTNEAHFGLDQPAVAVTLAKGDDPLVTVYLGKVSFGGSANSFVYVNTSDQKKPAALKRSDLGSFLRDTANAGTAGDLVRGAAD